jgi:hypothetical protein
MPLDRDELNRKLHVHASRLQAIGVALFVLGSAYWIGKQSRTHLAPLAKQVSDLRATNDKLTEWRRAFRPLDSAETALIRSDSAMVRSMGVPPGSRMQVAQLVGRQADEAGLSGVKLSFIAPPDSSLVPPRGQVGAIPITVAKYVVSVDFTGSFGAALKFVSHLPPSLTMTRFGVVTAAKGEAYHVVLSVYEVPNGSG